jgi:hypothetical protein
MSIRNKLILASRAHYDAHIRKHAMNVEVILTNPLAIPEHTDLMDAIEKELAIVDEYQGKLDALNKHFKPDSSIKSDDSDDSDNSNSTTTTDTTTITQADAKISAGANSHIVVERPFTV